MRRFQMLLAVVLGGVATPATAQDMGPVIPCNGVPPVGCCDGETLKFCKGGSLLTRDCSATPKCGWSDQDLFYNCGTAGAEDNKYPKACPAAPDSGGSVTDGGDSGDSGGRGGGDDGCSTGGPGRPVAALGLVLIPLFLLLRRRR